MSTIRALELRGNAGRLVNEARGILEKSKKENRELSQEEQVRFDKLHEEAEKNLNTAERFEKQALRDMGFNKPREEEPLARTEEDLCEKIEAAWDHGVDISDILSALEKVCREKGLHVEENWQDERGGRYWNRLAREIENCAVEVARIEEE